MDEEPLVLMGGHLLLVWLAATVGIASTRLPGSSVVLGNLLATVAVLAVLLMLTGRAARTVVPFARTAGGLLVWTVAVVVLGTGGAAGAVWMVVVGVPSVAEWVLWAVAGVPFSLAAGLFLSSSTARFAAAAAIVALWVVLIEAILVVSTAVGVLVPG